MPGVAEVLARVPLPGVQSLGTTHPDWHLDHPRTGDLLLVAAPNRQFVDPDDPIDARLQGNHGAPRDRIVPLFVLGGWPGLRAAPRDAPAPDLTDVAPTISRLLGLRPPRRLDGSRVPENRAGHPIEGIFTGPD